MKKTAALALFAGIAITGCEDTTIGVGNPILQLDPANLSFGAVQVGTERSLRVSIKNVGDGALALTGVQPGERFDEVFSFELERDQLDVPPGSQAFVNVTFAPIDLEDYAAELIVTPAPSEGLPPETIVITGRGATAELVIEPQNVSFGNVVIDTTKTLPVQITNASDTEADIEYVPTSNVKFCGAVGADTSKFCVAPTTKPLSAGNRFKLAPGESTSFDVSFTPELANTRENGEFRLKGCAACPAEAIKLDGIGVEQGFSCTPETLDFGFVNPQSVVSRNVTCENIANGQVTIVDWRLAAGTSADFEIDPPNGLAILEEGESADIAVRYFPKELGNDMGEIEIETDDGNLSVNLVGAGGGPDIDVAPLVVNFGQVSLIAPSRRTIQIANVGYDDLEVTEILIDTQGTGAFTGSPAGFIVPVGGFQDLTIEFQPTVEGPVTSEVIIKSSDQDEAEIVVQLIGEGINLPPCSFEVVPASLTFGVVERGRSSSRAFEVRNLGNSDCILTSARMLPGSDVEFSLPDGDLSSVRIAPASSTTIRVEYSPTLALTHSGAVEFSISSPTSPFNEVPLSGTGAESALLITPNDLDFGTIGVGCAARARTITIYNTGSLPAQINSIGVAAPADPAWTVSSLPAPLNLSPLTLQPGASTFFEVAFRAVDRRSYAGAIEISGTFEGNPVTYIVSLQGRGDLDAVQVDEFQQLGKPKVDILFVIDNSCSMGQEQNSLGANFQAFVQFATAQQLDYQLAVTTTDVGTSGEAGAFVGDPGNKIVTPQTQPAPETVFAQNVNVGINGSATEQGLQAAYLALSNPLIFNENAGFLRQDAVLSLIFVSDEPDQSPGAVDFFINFFLSIKGFRNTNLFTASSIVGDDPGGCDGSGGNASAGPRYVEAANRTGGIFQSICTSDWARSLEDLSTTAFGFKSRFFLSNQPVIATIEVYIDDVLIEDVSPGGTVNWSYDFGTNSINFSPFAVPEPGSDIRIEYTAECL